MNEKIKKVFKWIAGVLGSLFGLFVFVKSRDHRNGIADAEKRTADSGRAVETVADRVGQASGHIESVTERVEAVEGRIEDSKAAADRIAGGIDGARQGIAESVAIIDNIEKRNSH